MSSQEFDVAVVGGGSAGCAAAIAAARRDMRVLLIERYGFLGGTGTSVLDTFYGFFTPGEGEMARRVVGGIGWEVVEALEDQSAMMLRPNTYGAGTAVTYHPDILKIVWDRLVAGAGVHVLLHALCTNVTPACDGSSGGWQLEIATRTDRRAVTARCLIDASGDAQPATWAGARSEVLDAAKLQSLTTTFRVVNVDPDRAARVRHAELAELMARAHTDGYNLPRRDGSIHMTPITGSYVANMVRISGINPLIPEELTRAEMEGRRQALEYIRFLRDRVPGYGHAQLASLSTQVGVRESRRVLGTYTLTRDDILTAAKFADGIALCGAPIEDHHAGTGTRWEYLPPGETVDIPFRCLCPTGVSRVLVAGRCLSATHDAHAAVRSMGQCMAMGQAAGAAAAIAVLDGIDVHDIDVARLQAGLKAEGALLR